jgi:hypothetical protein
MSALKVYATKQDNYAHASTHPVLYRLHESIQPIAAAFTFICFYFSDLTQASDADKRDDERFIRQIAQQRVQHSTQIRL